MNRLTSRIAVVMRGKLAGELGSDADQDLAALVLRILGIPPDEARAIATRPLPSVDTNMGGQQS